MSNNMPIIDTHFHIWDSNKLSMPWLANAGDAAKPVYTLNDYYHATADFNIVKSCYEEVDVAKEDLIKEADYILEVCADKTNRVVGATLGCDLSQKTFKDYIERYADNHYVKSVRHNLFFGDPRACEDKVFLENTRLLGVLGIMSDVVLPAENIHYGAALVEACPDTTFVLNHCGLLPPATKDVNLKKHWQDGIKRYAQMGNTICKISDFLFLAENAQWQVEEAVPVVEFCLDAFGEDRIVFGTNWPVAEIKGSVKRWFDVLEVALQNCQESFRQKLFHKNAEKYYGV